MRIASDHAKIFKVNVCDSFTKINCLVVASYTDGYYVAPINNGYFFWKILGSDGI